MKKFLLLAVAAVTLTASANTLTAGTQELKLGTTKYTECKSIKSSNLSLNAVDNIAGTYVSKSVTEDPVNASAEVKIEVGTTANDYTITGLHANFPDVAVHGTLNGNQITIPDQVCYKHPTYGDCALYLADATNLYYITLTVLEDGTIAIPEGLGLLMIIVEEGTYYGSYIGSIEYDLQLLKSNGTITFDAYSNMTTPADPAVETYTSVVELTTNADDVVIGGAVCGFDNMTWLPFTVGDNNKIQFGADKVYYYSNQYDLAFATDFTETGTFYLNQGPSGTIDLENGTITMPTWGFILPTIDETPKYYRLNKIKKNTVITFPQVLSAINDVNVEKTTQARKVIVDGQLVIEKDGVRYNVAGQVIK